MRAVLRWIRADLRAHRVRTSLMVLVTAVTVVALILAAALLENATNPWQRVFQQSRGAHLWLHVQDGTDTSALARLDGVTAVAGPYRTAKVTLMHGREKASVELRASAARLPAVSRPLVRSGHWLAPSDPGGIVLEESLARSVGAGVGDRVTVQGAGGRPLPLRVAGIADSADQGSYPNWSPGLGWALPTQVRLAGSGSGPVERAVGLRLSDPSATDFTAQQAVNTLGVDQVTQVSTWRQVRSAMDLDNRLLGLLLGVFGLVALLAGALAVAAAAGDRVLGQLRDIAVLKALGFTPGQIVRMFLYEHTLLAVAGLALGTGAVTLLGPRLPGRLGEAMALWQALPGHTAALAATGACAVLSIALATVLPAWRAGRVSPAPAARVHRTGSRMSRLTRVALLLRLPPALVLGTRDAFHRPLRSGLTVGRLTIPIVMITMGLGTWATLDGFQQHPQRVGLAAALTARPAGLGDDAARRLLARTPGVAAAYPALEVEALVPGQTRTITVRGLGTAGRPYPYALAEGRGIRERDEAVAGQGLLDLMHIRVGQWVRVTAGGYPHILHIVGRSIEPDHNGEMLSVGLDALAGADGVTPAPGYYNVVLRPGAARDQVRAELLAASHGRLDVRPVANPADQLGAVRLVVVGLIAVLALIGLAELLTATSGGLRDHTRDLGVLRAMGLTPRQVAAVIVTSTGLLTLTAALLGTGLGVFVSDQLIDLQGRASGIGAGIAQTPSPVTLLLLTVAAVAAAAGVSVVPAVRALRAPVRETLSTA